MNVVVWQTVAAVAVLASAAAFVFKRAVVYASLLVVGCSIVASFGALGIEVTTQGGGTVVYGEFAVAILFGANALAGGIAFLAGVAGQYPQRGGDAADGPLGERSLDDLDDATKRLGD